jgi:hypothetical protein
VWPVPTCTARGYGYFYSGPKSTRKYLYSLFWNHIVRKTKYFYVIIAARSILINKPMEGYSGYYCHRKRFTLVYTTTDVTRLLFRLCFSWATSFFTSSNQPIFRASDVFLIHLPWQLLVPGVPGVVHVHTCTCITSTAVMSFHDPSHPSEFVEI